MPPPPPPSVTPIRNSSNEARSQKYGSLATTPAGSGATLALSALSLPLLPLLAPLLAPPSSPLHLPPPPRQPALAPAAALLLPSSSISSILECECCCVGGSGGVALGLWILGGDTLATADSRPFCAALSTCTTVLGPGLEHNVSEGPTKRLPAQRVTVSASKSQDWTSCTIRCPQLPDQLHTPICTAAL
jgi:hypothetical protein